jgi:hypothetical protein
MPNITVVVPAEFLTRPAVARAVANLALTLGGRDADRDRPTTAVTPTPVDVTPYAAAPNAPADVAAAPPIPADDALRVRWDDHVAGLGDNARKFLALLEKRGRLTQDEAVDLLALPGGKALGGVVGSIGRWTPVAGFKLPYAAEGERGTRSWVWTGIADAAATRSAPSAVPAKVAPAAVGPAATPDAAYTIPGGGALRSQVAGGE